MFGKIGSDLGAVPRGTRRFVHDNAAPSLGYRVKDCFHIERFQCRHVDHLSKNSLLRQPVGSGLRFVQHRAPAHKRHIIAFTQREAHIERQRFTVIRHFLFEQSVETSGFEKNDRIGVTNGRQQQSVGARRR